MAVCYKTKNEQLREKAVHFLLVAINCFYAGLPTENCTITLILLHSFRASDIKNAKKLPDGTQNRRSKPEISSVRHVLGHFYVGRFAGQTYYLLNLGIGLWRGAAVDQIYYRSVWDA